MGKCDNMKIDFENLFRFLDAKANSLYFDNEKLEELINTAKKKINENEVLMEIWDDLKTGFDMLKDWISGEYTDIPKKTITTLIIGILYLVSPIDIIPDFLPGGFLDDLAVLIYIFKTLESEISIYREWKKLRDEAEELFNEIDEDKFI